MNTSATKNETREDEAYRIFRDVRDSKGEPVTLGELVPHTDMSRSQLGNKLAGLVSDDQIRRVKKGLYDYPRRGKGGASQFDKDREDRDNENSHIRHGKLFKAGAGPGRMETDELTYDERLFSGTGIEPGDGHKFVQVTGSSMSPWVSEGEIVYCEETTEVEVEDLYVYWYGEDSGLTVAHFERTPDGLKRTKQGMNPSQTEFTHEEGEFYRDEEGRSVRIRIVGRIVGSFSRPAKAPSMLSVFTQQIKELV